MIVTQTQSTPFFSLAGGALIGASAVLLMATAGRIAGVSGYLARLFPPYVDHQLKSSVAFISGLVAAPFLYALVSNAPAVQTVTESSPVIVMAGLLVGFGSVTGNGCTSGHGVCGIARLSPRSLAAAASFMATAVATVFVVRHIVGA